MAALRSIRVIGVHPVVPSDGLFKETREIQWGLELSGKALRDADAAVREHFGSLYLIEIAVDPSNAAVDWAAITQPSLSQPAANWQVPYDERPSEDGRWAFFLHCVDLAQPLHTQLGPIDLPAPTPAPPHLAGHSYEVPG